MDEKNSFFNKVISVGLPFGLITGAFLIYFRGLIPGIIGGVVGGISFGVILAFFMEQQEKKLRVKGEKYEGELLVHQGPANHFAGIEARGGWLILTESTLHFKSHNKNFNNKPLLVKNDNIRGVKSSNTLGIIPNGILVILKDGKKERLVVQKRKEWLQAFNSIRIEIIK
jgi:hypothetical protein